MLFAAFESHSLPFACYLHHFGATTRRLAPICSIWKPYATYIRPTCCRCSNRLCLHCFFLPGKPTYIQAIAYPCTIHQLPLIVLPALQSSCITRMFYFPACQVRVSRFIRVASASFLLLRQLRATPSTNCELQISLGTAGPQPRALVGTAGLQLRAQDVT